MPNVSQLVGWAALQKTGQYAPSDPVTNNDYTIMSHSRSQAPNVPTLTEILVFVSQNKYIFFLVLL